MEEGDAPRLSLLDVVIHEYNAEKGKRTSRVLLTMELASGDQTIV